MRDDVAHDLRDSAHDFLRVVWPEICAPCGGGRLLPVESVTATEFERELDVLSGIDAWQIATGEGIRGIASRVQWIPAGRRHFETITVRRARTSGAVTELAKRIEAANGGERGFIQPHLIVHAYVSEPRREGALLYVAICRMSDVLAYAHDAYEGSAWIKRHNAADGNEFAAFKVPWLKANGVRVIERPKRQPEAA